MKSGMTVGNGPFRKQDKPDFHPGFAGARMAHLLQVGVGSGGMPLLDMLARLEPIDRVTLIDPDLYQSHNVVRHLFPVSTVGQFKVDLAARWLLDRRPDLPVEALRIDITDPSQQSTLDLLASQADLGVCAVDNESAKYVWDGLMRRHDKSWTLGEVLSGGIGGFVHWFRPGGACYGCVAGYLKREVREELTPPPPDYSAPNSPVPETSISASMSSIHAIAALHALVTQELLEQGGSYDPGFTSLLLTLRRVEGLFSEAYRPIRMTIHRSPDCLICQNNTTMATGEALDVALDEALERLAHE